MHPLEVHERSCSNQLVSLLGTEGMTLESLGVLLLKEVGGDVP